LSRPEIHLCGGRFPQMWSYRENLKRIDSILAARGVHRMTLEEIEKLLPNGLHDAQIKRMTRDYESAELVLKVRVLIGLPNQPLPDRDRYRTADILFRQVYFCAVELPQTESAFRHPGSIWFSYERMRPNVIPDSLAKTLPIKTQCYSIFLRDWMSEMHVATQDVEFSWSD
jgi:hypothetical protein